MLPQSLQSPNHEAVIGKNKLNPVLHQTRKTPGTANGGFHQYHRSENLAINKSQEDMKGRFKNASIAVTDVS
jgi:hypothetical protein